jgi:hypothetical protein
MTSIEREAPMIFQRLVLFFGLFMTIDCSAPMPATSPRGSICRHGSECADSAEVGAADISWCIRETENGSGYCSRVPCTTIGADCTTGGTCQAPDVTDTLFSYPGHCQKTVCMSDNDCGVGFACSSRQRCERAYVETVEFYLNR